MAASLNKVMIIGNIGKDPEMRYTQGGKAVLSFGVAVSQGKGDQETTEWFNVVAWDKLAEGFNQVGGKGRKVYAEGRQQTRTWEKDGQKHSRTELVAGVLLVLDAKPAGAGNGEARPTASAEQDPFDVSF